MKKDTLQHNLYNFPYHYIPRKVGNTYILSREWGFSTSYLAALDLIQQQLNISSKSYKLRALDVGCGDGALINHLNKTELADLYDFVGIDQDPLAINWAKLFNPNTHFLIGNLSQVEDKYDVVTLIEVLEHIHPENLKRFTREIANVLEFGGRLIITVPSTEKALEVRHYQHFTFVMLEELFCDDFEIIEIRGFERRTFIERVLKKIHSNKFFSLKSQILIRSIVNRLSKKSFKSKGCGRIFCVMRRKQRHGWRNNLSDL